MNIYANSLLVNNGLCFPKNFNIIKLATNRKLSAKYISGTQNY